MVVFLPINTQAEEVTYGQYSRTKLNNGKTWLWQIIRVKGLKIFELRQRSGLITNTKSILSADISDCSFCSGKGDNCAEDGVDILTTPNYPNAFVQIICHVGAHSQRLMIFDPKKDQKNPIYQRSGVYWISSSQGKRGLSLAYDKSGFGPDCPSNNSDPQPNANGICEIHEIWP
jgi:hypothetical protein